MPRPGVCHAERPYTKTDDSALSVCGANFEHWPIRAHLVRSGHVHGHRLDARFRPKSERGVANDGNVGETRLLTLKHDPGHEYRLPEPWVTKRQPADHLSVTPRWIELQQFTCTCTWANIVSL